MAVGRRRAGAVLLRHPTAGTQAAVKTLGEDSRKTLHSHQELTPVPWGQVGEAANHPHRSPASFLRSSGWEGQGWHKVSTPGLGQGAHRRGRPSECSRLCHPKHSRGSLSFEIGTGPAPVLQWEPGSWGTQAGALRVYKGRSQLFLWRNEAATEPR